jgi:hypothetical protein
MLETWFLVLVESLKGLLSFNEWDIDGIGERTSIPYHVKLNIEGIPQHAWTQEIADKVFCDEAFIHHVEEGTRKKIDQRIPHAVYLTLIKNEPKIYNASHVHFVRPRGMKQAHVFKVLIHIDVVEDLLFYHYPREELLADGKVPWRDFVWQYGTPDGEIDGEEFMHLTNLCGPELNSRWRPSDDDEGDKEQKRPRTRGFMGKSVKLDEGPWQKPKLLN